MAICLAAACAGASLAERLYKAGQRAEHAGDTLHAYLFYARAATLDPTNVAYATHKAALQSIAALSSDVRIEPETGVEPDPDTAEAPESGIADDLIDGRDPLPPPSLEGSPEHKSFDLKGDARTVFEKVAEAYGLMVVFDANYQSPPVFTYRMNDVGFEEAFRGLEAQSDSFLIPVNAKLALVARDTPQKRAELEPVMAIGIPIPERISVQESQEMVTAVQSSLDMRRIRTDAAHRMIYIRETVSKINAARLMFSELSRLRAQVEVDVEFLSVEKTSSLNYGFNLPNSFPLVDFGHFGSILASTPIPSGVSSFMAFGGGGTFIGLGIAAANAMATASKNSATTVLTSQVVSLDGQAATLHVGQRYPIISNGYYGASTGTGQVYTPPPTVTYQDLGLVLKVTPSVHDDEDVTLDLESEFSILGAGSSIAGIPIVSSRKFTGKVRLKAGEWAVVAGLVQSTDSDSQNGMAGLSNIPLIGKFFSQNNLEKDTGQILLVLKPRLVNLPPWEYAAPPIWTGTESRPLTAFGDQKLPVKPIELARNYDPPLVPASDPEPVAATRLPDRGREEAVSRLPRILQASRAFLRKTASDVTAFILAAVRAPDQSAPRAERAATPRVKRLPRA